MSPDQSLALNLFLSRCEMSFDELVDCIEDADETKIGLSAIRHLNNTLPPHEEVEYNVLHYGPPTKLREGNVFSRVCSDGQAVPV